MSAVQNSQFSQTQKKIGQRKQFYQHLCKKLNAAAMLYTNMMEVLMQISNKSVTNGPEL